MTNFIKSLVVVSLIVMPFSMQASVQADANDAMEAQSTYQSPLATHYQATDAVDAKPSNSSAYVPNGGGPLNDPFNPPDPNAPIDTNMYFLIAASLVYGFVLFRKEKRLKL
jgi:hypothetical protein